LDFIAGNTTVIREEIDILVESCKNPTIKELLAAGSDISNPFYTSCLKVTSLKYI